MSGITDAIGGFMKGVIKPVLDKFIGDKMSDAERAQMELEILEATQAQQDKFWDFVVAHSGKASELPPFIQVVRGLVRPLITFANFGLFIFVLYQFFFNTALPVGRDPMFAIKVVFGLNLLTLGFWFGDKALQRSGLIDLLLRNRTESESLGG